MSIYSKGSVPPAGAVILPSAATGALLRPSRRAVSGWVLWAAFPPGAWAAAAGLARRWAALLPARAAPRLRRSGGGWAVSVPVRPPAVPRG